MREREKGKTCVERAKEIVEYGKKSIEKGGLWENRRRWFNPGNHRHADEFLPISAVLRLYVTQTSYKLSYYMLHLFNIKGVSLYVTRGRHSHTHQRCSHTGKVTCFYKTCLPK